MPRRCSRIVALAALATLVAGCKVDARVSIRLEEDGSGSVAVRLALDSEAVAVLEQDGGSLEDRVRLDDLVDAGWRVTKWVREVDGSAWIRVSQSFAGEEELSALISDIGGDGELLAEPRIERTRGFLRARDGVSLVADLEDLETRLLDDEELVSRLESSGLDVAALDAQLQDDLADAFALTVTMQVDDETRSFRLEPGETDTLDLSATDFDTGRLALLLIGSMLVFLAVLLYLGASISGRRRQERALARGPFWARGDPMM